MPSLPAPIDKIGDGVPQRTMLPTNHSREGVEGMTAHVLPRFLFLPNRLWQIVLASPTALLCWMLTEPTAYGYDRPDYHRGRAGLHTYQQNMQRKPAATKPQAQAPKDKNKDAKEQEKVEIPHMLDWLNDTVFVCGLVGIVFLLIILWVYIFMFRRLDAVAYLQRPSPRGVLYVPPEIEQLVADQLRDKSAPPEERKKLIETYVLRYYFGGQEVICRDSPDGLAVLAAGPEEVPALLSKMTEQEKGRVRIEKPELWEMGPIKL
jgi:hypothetical protein